MQDISINKILLIGRIDGEPDLRYTGNNKPLCKLRVITTENYTNRDGRIVESRTSHMVIVWGQKAERLKDQLYANARVYVEGSIRHRAYEDSMGEKKFSTEINAQTVFSIDSEYASDHPEYHQRGSGQQGGYAQQTKQEGRYQQTGYPPQDESALIEQAERMEKNQRKAPDTPKPQGGGQQGNRQQGGYAQPQQDTSNPPSEEPETQPMSPDSGGIVDDDLPF